jgi:histidinol-phosphate/aromatic aminotransferase/cobyric acid decarboxylase-like protein
MGFPLGEWIDSHAGVRHNLGQSGMKGSLRTYDRSLRRLPAPDPNRLRTTLGRLVGAPASAVFLTHGATEGNALVLHHLARTVRTDGNGGPRLRIDPPEYPPIPDTAELAGFRIVGPGDRAEVAAVASPRNPLGTAVGPGELDDLVGRSRAVLLDETFREFSGRPSAASERRPGRWVTGTFTKAFGGDDLRVGFVVAPPEGVDEFARYHALATDRVAPASVAGALALLRDRAKVVGEARAILRANEAVLREAFPDFPPLGAPVWFDRGFDGDRLARRALRASVLVCPGSFFGTPRGVRIGLTRRSFPDDLAAYLAVRRGAG